MEIEMKRNNNSGAIGRVLSATLRTARAEFIEDNRVEEGAFICFRREGKNILGRIDKLETHRYAGLTGYLYWLDPIDRPPRAMQELFMAADDKEEGILYIGKDRKGEDLSLHLNPFFKHTIVAGMTQQGKTHLCIILLEEMIERDVPCLIIDSHGEFVNLAKSYPKKAYVVESLRIEDLIPHLQQRHTVVYNLLGLPKVSKANRVGEILEALMTAKEQDYARAENHVELLEIPPVMLFVDEAELYAPNKTSKWGVRSGALIALTSIAKEGAKFGLGMVVVPQRVTKLDVDVRGQCNSAAIFRIVDTGSRQAVSRMDFISKSDLKAIGSFTQGVCLLGGAFVKRPRIVVTRDITTEKVKKVDFEEILGIDGEPMKKKVYASKFVKKDGDIVDSESGEVVETAEVRMLRDDKEAFEAHEGDGIIRRSHITEDEQQVLKRLRKPNKKGDRIIG